MKVSDCMTMDVEVARPGDTIQEAARLMCEIDAGVLPVSNEERLVGMITDRDITVRAVARGLGPDCRVSDVMSREVLYCFDDEDVDDVLRNMADIKVRRLPVVTRDKRLVGIVSMADLTDSAQPQQTGAALGEISREGGQHNQTLH